MKENGFPMPEWLADGNYEMEQKKPNVYQRLIWFADKFIAAIKNSLRFFFVVPIFVPTFAVSTNPGRPGGGSGRYCSGNTGLFYAPYHFPHAGKMMTYGKRRLPFPYSKTSGPSPRKFYRVG